MSTPRHVTSKKEIFSTERVFFQDCLKVWVRIARAHASCPEITCTRTAVILQLQPCRTNGIHLSESIAVSRSTMMLALCARGGHRRYVASANFVSYGGQREPCRQWRTWPKTTESDIQRSGPSRFSLAHFCMYCSPVPFCPRDHSILFTPPFSNDARAKSPLRKPWA